jgi:hypothetical protein
MASAFPGWILDPARNLYYYYSQEEGAYVYQDGEKVYINSRPQENVPSAALASASASGPRNVPASYGHHNDRQFRRDRDRERDGAEKLKTAAQKDGLSEDPMLQDAAAYIPIGPSGGKLNGRRPCSLDFSHTAFAKYIHNCTCRQA